jgi:hypothetical protein
MAETSQTRDPSTERPRETGQARYADDGAYPSDAGDVVRGISRLACAWAQASAHALFDTVAVVNDVAADVTDSVLGSVTPSSAARGAPTHNPDGNPPRRGYGDRRRTQYAGGRDHGQAPVVDQVNSSLSRALRGAADAISRAADEFSRLYDQDRETAPPEPATMRARRAQSPSSAASEPQQEPPAA